MQISQGGLGGINPMYKAQQAKKSGQANPLQVQQAQGAQNPVNVQGPQGVSHSQGITAGANVNLTGVAMQPQLNGAHKLNLMA